MVTYVPGTEEQDPKKAIMSLQQIGPRLDTAVTNIATNTTNIATNTTNIATNTTNIATNTTNIATHTTTLANLAAPLTNSLGADVLLNNVSNYFDGPSVAQGTSGTWFASGTVVINDASTAQFNVKLWDGTTVIASAVVISISTSTVATVSVSGFITNPAGNIRISVRDASTTAGKILFNLSGNSKDSTITAIRLA